MSILKSFEPWLLLLPFLFACSAKVQRKSAEYYKTNKAAITQIRNDFETLYQQQPFSGGFTDRTFTYYEMEVVTDTLRSIFNTERSEKRLYETILRFNYDTAMLKKLSDEMKDVKCLWLGKTSFYTNGIKDTITFLSFKSVLIERPFAENKYYVLLFLNRKIDSPEAKARVKKGDFVKVDNLVYFTIASGFR